MKSMFHMVGCLLTAMVFSASADTLIENYRYGTDSGSGVADQAVFFEPSAGTLDKVGSGTRTIPIKKLRGFGSASVQALEGSLVISDSGSAPAESSEAPEAAIKAFMWFDAATNVTTGADGQMTWYDRREEKQNSVWGTTYQAGQSLIVSSDLSHPVVRQDGDGRNFLYFNGYKSGTYMKFLKTDRSQYASGSSIVRHIFTVHRIESTYGTIWGNTSYPMFRIGDTTDSMSASYLHQYLNTRRYASGGRFYRNGADVDPYALVVQRGVQLMDWSGTRVNAAALGGFFHQFEGGAPSVDRSGGDDLGEVLVFTNLLTSAERVSIERYLMKKWQIGAPDPNPLAIRAAEGVTVTLEANGDGVLSGPMHFAVTGAGSGEKTGSGDLSLGEWYGGLLMAPFHLGAGRVIDYSGTIPVMPQDGEGYTFEGDKTARPVLTKTTVPAGSVALSGPAGYAVWGLPSSVKSLSATGDALALRGADADLRGGPVAGAVEATIPNGTFESDVSGWTVNRLNGSDTYFTIVTLPAPGDWKVENSYPAPQGSKALLTRYGFEAVTTVQVPVAGAYELSFATCARGTTTTAYERWVDVGIITGTTTNILARCRPSRRYGFIYNRYRTPTLAAGSHQLYIAYTGGEQAMHLMDDFRMRRITDETEEVVAVPNGNFERLDLAGTTRYGNETFNGANTFSDWTLTQSATGSTAPWSAAPVTINMAEYYRNSRSPYGETQLALMSNGGKATSAAFTLPAGTWRLKCRAAALKSSVDVLAWHDIKLTADAVLSASVRVDETDVALGQVTVSNVTTRTVFAPNALRLTGTERVVLSLEQTVEKGAVVLDDLVFVRDGDDELVAGGEISKGESCWTFTSHRNTDVEMLKNSGAAGQSLTTDWIGYATCAGSRAARLIQCGEMSQTVDFPAAGTYRLSFWTRPRAAVSGANPISQGGNVVQASIARGTVTNVIGRSSHVFSTNFVRQVFYFTVPNAGQWTLSLRGCNGLPKPDGTYEVAVPDGFSTTDAWALVDGISVRPVKNLGAAPSGLAGSTLTLGEGTRLYLDYSGDVLLKSLRLGGQKCSGWVDHATYPDLVFGPGRAYVTPKGFSLNLR